VVNVSKTYVAGFCDSWPEAFEAARSALGFRDRAGEKKDNLDMLKPTVESNISPWAITNSASNDATQGFRWALNTMKKNLRCGTGVYNYRDFEDKYGLVWGVTPELQAPRSASTPKDDIAAFLRNNPENWERHPSSTTTTDENSMLVLMKRLLAEEMERKSKE
jgi:hypothetical protein